MGLNNTSKEDIPRPSKIVNHRNLLKKLENTEIFDLTEMINLPIRLLSIQKDSLLDKKKLYFWDVEYDDLFNNDEKYIVIGEVNRTTITKDYIVRDIKGLYNAIQKYIIAALQKRIDPLDYFLLEFNRIFELRQYKKLLGNQKPKLIIS